VKRRVLSLFYVALTCVGADLPQCARIANATFPASVPGGGHFRVFKNQWILNSDEGTFVSSDKGTTWRQVLPPPPPPSITTVIVGPFDGALFAIPSSGNFVFESQDGVAWKTVPTPVHPGFFASVGDLWVIQGTQPGSDSINLRMSRDAGHTWTQAPSIDPVFPPRGMTGFARLIRTKGRILLVDNVDFAVVPPTPPQRHWITRVRRLSPNAERWEDVTPCACSVLFDEPGLGNSTDFESVLAGTVNAIPAGEAHLLVTTDAGTTWSFRPLPAGSPAVLDSVVVMLFGGYTLFTPRYLYSTEAGVSWRALGDGLPYYPPVGLPTTGLIGRTEDSLVFKKVPGSDVYGCNLR
jgi:hypothetical protein